MREYMPNTRTPSCRLERNLAPAGGVAILIKSTAILFGVPGVPGRGIEDKGLGVRGFEFVEEWKAYVINSDSARMTSWLRFDLTSISKASMKCETTSSETASPFIASNRRFTIPSATLVCFASRVICIDLTYSSVSVYGY